MPNVPSANLLNDLKPMNSNRLIYLITDNKHEISYLVDALKQEKYNVKNLEKISDISAFCENELPLAIIMDVDVKKVNQIGYDLGSTLKEKVDKYPPIIFLSDSDSTLNRLSAIREGASYYCHKSTNSKEFGVTVIWGP